MLFLQETLKAYQPYVNFLLLLLLMFYYNVSVDDTTDV